MKTDQAVVERAKWDTVYLVCRACGKRRNGATDPKPKALATLARQALKGGRPRPRVLLTSCLGLCPKAATAVAIVGGSGSRIVAIRSKVQFAGVIANSIRERETIVSAVGQLS